jgi:hypothetical protein
MQLVILNAGFCLLIQSSPVFTHCQSSSDYDGSSEWSTNRLRHAAAFLPLARSSASLDYFLAVSKRTISDGKTVVVAMDLGSSITHLFNPMSVCVLLTTTQERES